jgi:hypothetical protein
MLIVVEFDGSLCRQHQVIVPQAQSALFLYISKGT